MRRTDALLEEIVTGLLAGDAVQARAANPRAAGLRYFTNRLLQLVESVIEQRHRQQQRIDFLEALLDNVPAALLVIENGAPAPVNRAARALAGGALIFKDAATPCAGFAGGDPLAHTMAGQRSILRLANDKRALVTAVGFSDSAAKRLLSVQVIESELDLVELEAWQNLVRILAHEMMNSLTPISSLAAGIKPRIDALCDLAVAAPERLATARDACAAADIIARRSLALIDFVARYRQVMELPRPQLKPVALSELFAHVEKFLSPTLDQKSIALSLEISPPTLTVNADGALLQQALINLFYNAIDALAGFPNPVIVLQGADYESHVEIRVGDNGAGIDVKIRDKIFVPFFTTKTHGAGVGLSLVHKIVLAHQGRIEVGKNSPRGSVFTIRLPQGRAVQLKH